MKHSIKSKANLLPNNKIKGRKIRKKNPITMNDIFQFNI
jgi:hypothetical protein